MTLRQRLLKWLYPLFVKATRNKAGKSIQGTKSTPSVPFYSLPFMANSGTDFDISGTRGKKVLLVNTASDCGYTGQYEGLEELYRKYQDKLVIIGFPANDFKEQEKGTDEEIASFCKINYGVTFPLMKKSSVIAGPGQNKVYQWLTDPQQNGWNSQQPTWNFSKYLVDEEGRLAHYFGPAVEPMSDEVINLIKQA